MIWINLSAAVGGWIVSYGFEDTKYPDELFTDLPSALTRIAFLSAQHEAERNAEVSEQREIEIDAALNRGLKQGGSA